MCQDIRLDHSFNLIIVFHRRQHDPPIPPPTPHYHLTNRMTLVIRRLQAVVILMVTIRNELVLRDLALLLILLLPLMLVRLCVRHLQLVQDKLDVLEERVTTRTAEVLTNDNAHELELLRVRSHGVCWNDPAALPEFVGNGKFVVLKLDLGVETEGNQGETLASGLGHDDEAERLQGLGEIVGGVRDVGHD